MDLICIEQKLRARWGLSTPYRADSHDERPLVKNRSAGPPRGKSTQVVWHKRRRPGPRPSVIGIAESAAKVRPPQVGGGGLTLIAVSSRFEHNETSASGV
jgi:hypothetical protein